VWAVIVSILLHVLLVILSVWFPVSRSAAVVVDEPEQTITFSFDRDVAPTTDDPREDARFSPLEPRPSALPAQVPVPDRPESPPLDATEPVAPQAPLDDPAPPEAAPEQFEAAETVEPPEPPGSGLPQRPDDGARQSPTPPQDASPNPDIDLQQALRDFGRARASRPAAPQPSQPSDRSQSNVFVPDLSSIPMSGFGMGNLVFESRDYDWSDYGRQVYMAIWRAWHNRLWMTTDEFEKWAYRNQDWRLKDASQVRFVIESNGQVTGIVHEGGDGCEPLDASALDALAEVILPPLPADFPRDREVVHARFFAEGPVRAMRPVLGRYKAMGLF
jgi:hypothetical protein